MFWLIGLSSEHSSAIQDFSTQVQTLFTVVHLASGGIPIAFVQVMAQVELMVGHQVKQQADCTLCYPHYPDVLCREACGCQMVFSSSMAKQASTTWLHTGAATTNLSALNQWTSVLLQDCHSNAKISTLRFGTTDGLEESCNGTSTGINIMRRDGTSYSDCLKTYLSDGTTVDASHADKCDYDPRFTSWYQAALGSANSSTFSDTYNNSWLAAVTKACAGSDCSSGISGVWASEWEISSISDSLAQLIDGFEGSLAVIDFNGIVLSTSSGITLEPAITCNDSFIREASKESVGNTQHFKKSWSGAMLRETLIGVDVLAWLDYENFPDVTTQYFGMMALERRQLYREYEEYRNTGLATICFGLIFLGLILDKVTDKAKSSLLHTCDRHMEIQEKFEDAMESPFVKGLRTRFSQTIQTLKCHLERHPIRISDLKYLDGLTAETSRGKGADDDESELSLHEALRWVAVSFLHDYAQQRDIELHLALLLCSPVTRTWLIPLFRVFSSRTYWLGTSSLLGALLWLQLVETGSYSITNGFLLGLLCIDAVLFGAFHTIQSWRLEVKTQDISGVFQLVARRKTRFTAAWLYMLLLFLAFSAQHTSQLPNSMVAYITPLLVLLRNEDIW